MAGVPPDGRPGSTTAEAAVSATAEPAAFDPVTRPTIVLPWSARPTT